jgi:hypothetical protein
MVQNAPPKQIGGAMRLESKVLLVAAAIAVLGVLPVSAAQPGCDRACLEGFVDRYLDAVAANRPSQVPLSPNVRFTEDGQRLIIGDGLWNTMKGKGKYRLFITDVPAGQVVFLGTIQEDHREPDNFNGSLISLRLQVRNMQITEVEQIVFRFPNETGDAFNRSYNRVDAMATHPLYLQAVPVNERMSRAGPHPRATSISAACSRTTARATTPSPTTAIASRTAASPRTCRRPPEKNGPTRRPRSPIPRNGAAWSSSSPACCIS